MARCDLCGTEIDLSSRREVSDALGRRLSTCEPCAQRILSRHARAVATPAPRPQTVVSGELPGAEDDSPPLHGIASLAGSSRGDVADALDGNGLAEAAPALVVTRDAAPRATAAEPAVSPAADTRYTAYRLSAECPQCDEPLPLAGPVLTVRCESCHEQIELTPDFWRTLLEEGAERLEPGKMHEIKMLRGGLTAAGRWSRRMPRCLRCDAELDADAVATGRETPIACPSCGSPAATHPAPDWLRQELPGAAQLFCAAREGPQPSAPGAGAQAATVPCPKCSTALDVTAATKRVFPCARCRNLVMVPDPIWQTLHPVSRDFWFLRFEGPTPCEIEAARREQAEREEEAEREEAEREEQRRRESAAEAERECALIRAEYEERKEKRAKLVQAPLGLLTLIGIGGGVGCVIDPLEGMIAWLTALAVLISPAVYASYHMRAKDLPVVLGMTVLIGFLGGYFSLAGGEEEGPGSAPLGRQMAPLICPAGNDVASLALGTYATTGRMGHEANGLTAELRCWSGASSVVIDKSDAAFEMGFAYAIWSLPVYLVGLALSRRRRRLRAALLWSTQAVLVALLLAAPHL